VTDAGDVGSIPTIRSSRRMTTPDDIYRELISPRKGVGVANLATIITGELNHVFCTNG
jgi:hypothetical protein